MTKRGPAHRPPAGTAQGRAIADTIAWYRTLAALFAAVTIAVVAYGIRATAGRAPRPTSAKVIVITPIFPRLPARNLEGREVELPDAFDGHLNVVAIAFRREHQGLVDSR